MRVIKSACRTIIKILLAILLIAILAIITTSASLVYHFREARPFKGEKIFNPYRNFNTSHGWKRANFHTHTKVEGPLNECQYTPKQTLEFYNKFGYDIITFSNHNTLTSHPTDPALQVNLYEHGYNLFKFHKLVFGSQSVNYFDHLLPLFTFQKQFQLDILKSQSDIVVLNHPLRTTGLNSTQMQRLSGYDIIELDSGKSTENEYWDTALSAGNYSFALANDDLHHPDRSGAIAVRCNFLQTPSAMYNDIKQTLLEGCYYSMRIPDYGSGNWQVKSDKHRDLPAVKNIGVVDNTVFIALTEVADSIKLFGQHHTTLAIAKGCDSLSYTMHLEEPYSRFTAYFPGGEIIYSNPFARYDHTIANSPFTSAEHRVNIIMTILYNLTLAALFTGIAIVLFKTVFVWRIL